MAIIRQKTAFGPGVYRGRKIDADLLRQYAEGTNKAIAAGVPIPLLKRHAKINASDNETLDAAQCDGAGWLTKVEVEPDGSLAWEAKDVPADVQKGLQEGHIKFTSPEFRSHYQAEKAGVYEGPVIRHFAFTPVPGNPIQGPIETVALAELGVFQFAEEDRQPLPTVQQFGSGLGEGDEDEDVTPTDEHQSRADNDMTPVEEVNPFLAPVQADPNKLKAIIAGLNQKGIALPVDWNPMSPGAIDILLGCLNSNITTENNAEIEAAKEQEVAMGDQGNPVETAMPFSETEQFGEPINEHYQRNKKLLHSFGYTSGIFQKGAVNLADTHESFTHKDGQHTIHFHGGKSGYDNFTHAVSNGGKLHQGKTKDLAGYLQTLHGSQHTEEEAPTAADAELDAIYEGEQFSDAYYNDALAGRLAGQYVTGGYHGRAPHRHGKYQLAAEAKALHNLVLEHGGHGVEGGKFQLPKSKFESFKAKADKLKLPMGDSPTQDGTIWHVHQHAEEAEQFAHREPADEHLATKLHLVHRHNVGENDTPRLTTDEYHKAGAERRGEHHLAAQHKAIRDNLAKKHKKGVYDHEKAKKLWGYYAKNLSDHYKTHYGVAANPATRALVAAKLADDHREKHLSQHGETEQHAEHDHSKLSDVALSHRYNKVLQKIQKAFKGGTRFGVDEPTLAAVHPELHAEYKSLKQEGHKRYKANPAKYAAEPEQHSEEPETESLVSQFSEEELAALPPKARQALEAAEQARIEAEQKAQQFAEQEEATRNQAALDKAKQAVSAARIPPGLRMRLLAGYESVQFSEGVEPKTYTAVEVAEMFAAATPPHLQFAEEDTVEAKAPKANKATGRDANGNLQTTAADSSQFFEDAGDGLGVGHVSPERAEELVASNPLLAKPMPFNPFDLSAKVAANTNKNPSKVLVG